MRRWSNYRRRQRAALFARESAALFKQIDLQSGDQVFLPTVSEIDLLGLAQYLARDERTRRVNWRLQFHFSIDARCASGTAGDDERLEPLLRIYRDAMSLADDRRLYFYATTDELTKQHNRLAAGQFQTLPYPVNPQLGAGRTQSAGERRGPVRIVSLGDARHEKGFHHLPRIVERLWDDYIATDLARFILQANMQFALPAQGENIAVAESVAALSRRSPSKVEMQTKPLDSDTFRKTVQSADVGVLLYDREIYFARCSGVLVELLSAGVPVLVSAGCWMADQLADVTRDYHTSLRHNGRVLGNAPLHGRSQHPAPDGSRDLLLFFLWPEPTRKAPPMRASKPKCSPRGRRIGLLDRDRGPRRESALEHRAGACAAGDRVGRARLVERLRRRAGRISRSGNLLLGRRSQQRPSHAAWSRRPGRRHARASAGTVGRSHR